MGGLLFLTINSQSVTLKITRKYLLKFTNVYIHKLIKWNFINEKKGRNINLKGNRINKRDI